MGRVLAVVLVVGLLPTEHLSADARQRSDVALTLREAVDEALAHGSRALRVEDDVETARLDLAQANAFHVYCARPVATHRNPMNSHRTSGAYPLRLEIFNSPGK